MNEPLKRQVLVEWFRRNRRDLPWRSNRSPYSVWISEVMLQQTVLKAVIPYYITADRSRQNSSVATLIGKYCRVMNFVLETRQQRWLLTMIP